MTWKELHEACEHQDVTRIIKIAHQRGEDAFEVDEHGWTPLHVLSWGNPTLEAVEALLKACPQALTNQDYHGNTPLHVACSFAGTDKHVVQMLLEACPTAVSKVNLEGLMPLHMACRYAPANQGVIDLLIEAYPYALQSRIKMGNLVARKNGKSQERDVLRPKSTDHVPLDPSAGMATKAAVDMHFDGLNKQIRDGAYPLHMAVEAGAPFSVIEMLTKEGLSVLSKTNKFGETPLHLALKHMADDDIVEVLLTAEPKAVDMADKTNGNTPLHVAALVGCSERVAKALLGLGLSVIRVTNAQGLTPLELAIASGVCAQEVVRLFEIANDTW